MQEPTKQGLVFLSGFTLCALLLWGCEGKLRAPDGPRADPPRDPESLLVLEWLVSHRGDGPRLTVVQWWPPLRLKDNPLSHGRATLIHVLVRTNQPEGREALEDLLFYIHEDVVLGPVRNGEGGHDPREASSKFKVQSSRFKVPGKEQVCDRERRPSETTPPRCSRSWASG